MGKEISKLNILIVDDIAFMRRTIIECLLEIGISLNRIHEADNGLTALSQLETGINSKELIDIVVSDWNMPTMNGLKLLKTIRGSGGITSKTPFIMVTTVSEKEQIVEALEYDLSGYLIKPVETNKLKDIIYSIADTE